MKLDQFEKEMDKLHPQVSDAELAYLRGERLFALDKSDNDEAEIV